MAATDKHKLLKGRFEVLEAVGEGGFARVYHARETTTGQKVALKVLKDGFQNDPEVMERFRREVFAVASIDSPHVVGLKDFGISGDEFFIAMEFVEGPTLREVMEQMDWSAETIHSIIGQIANAIGSAHTQNIVHRDLKPENVMLVSGPNDTMMVKVLDFGLAKLAELERNLGLAPLTRVGMCFGTPQYMSPELIYGKGVDRAVDLFALAVMAYEMIAGHRPWDGAAPQEVMVAVAKTPMPPITAVHASLAARIEPINEFFRRALSKRKDDRPSDAASLFDGLSIAMFGHTRALSMPNLGDSAELLAIQALLPGRPRTDETQLDMGDRVIDSTAEKDMDLESMRPRTPIEAQVLPSSVTKRGDRLSSTWIPSMSSTPSMIAPLDDEPDLPLSDTARAPAQQVVPTARGFPVMLFVLGMLLALAFAGGAGYFIGRGH
ncbi:MAG: serine/threonine-protein kinase [Polyangia bacterium]